MGRSKSMINLFNIPNHIINTSQFSNLLHDKIVRDFEKRFAKYVGAKYAVSFNSATSAIFLITQHLTKYKKIFVPSLIPPVVPNAIINGGGKCVFTDDVDWIGGSYSMETLEDFNIIDSAQRVDKGQYKKNGDSDALMIFSFYPTKPIGSCDGGMVVSNDEEKIERLRELTLNGMSMASNNWERRLSSIGHKMYMNSIQAYMANENMSMLEDKKKILKGIRNKYNFEFRLKNTSDHLYRVRVDDNEKFITFMKKSGIVCGIHYKALHDELLYRSFIRKGAFEESEKDSSTMASIPFHERLTESDISKIIYKVNEYKNL